MQKLKIPKTLEDFKDEIYNENNNITIDQYLNLNSQQSGYYFVDNPYISSQLWLLYSSTILQNDPNSDSGKLIQQIM